ncbi:MAG TPA: AGE family epimerase/isomerase [Bacillota bacterium]|nr:AGE family epimerase/isomerase [Bacillota bacterium]
MDHQYILNLTQFYQDQLYNKILPFWLTRGIDSQYGGYFTCFTNTGEQRVSTDKYVWSQGRFVWLFSKLAEFQDSVYYLEQAKQGVAFLKKHCFLTDGRCAFLLSRDGTPLEPVPGQGFDYSVYADCFVVLGFAKYAAVSDDQLVLDLALQLYDSIIDRIKRGDFQTNPEPTPKGYKCHGIPMILLNVSQELSRSLTRLKHPRAAEIEQRCLGFTREVMQEFCKSDLLFELVNPEDPAEQSWLTGFINPGHSIENMWFIMHQAIKYENGRLIEQTVDIVAKMFQIGWDQEYGGLFHFVDGGGGRPHVPGGEIPSGSLKEKLQTGWDDKLWWVHSEALYTTLLGYHLTGDRRMKECYRKVHDYSFGTFPNSDASIGEWIQIRDRYGKPQEKVVALPVKDPFHIIRNFIQIIELLQNVSQG